MKIQVGTNYDDGAETRTGRTLDLDSVDMEEVKKYIEKIRSALPRDKHYKDDAVEKIVINVYDIEYDITYRDVMEKADELGIKSTDKETIYKYIEEVQSTLPDSLDIELTLAECEHCEADPAMIQELLRSKVEEKTGWYCDWCEIDEDDEAEYFFNIFDDDDYDDEYEDD